MRPLKEKVSITLDNDVVMDIKTLAERDNRSFSQYIHLILKKYLEHQNAPDGSSKNGL